MNLDHTAEKLNQHKTVELRKLAKQYDIKETGGRPVNSGRKADLIASILRSIETLRQSDEAAKPAKASAPKNEGTHSSRKQMCRECGKRKIHFGTQGSDSTMCVPCFEYAGWENTHSDDDHNADAEPQSDLWDEMAECPVCERAEIGPFAKAPAGSPVHAKALRFEADAKAAGWSALARNGSEDGVSLVTARRGNEELKILWVGGVFQYDRSGYKAKDGAKEIRVRNASAARKLLAS